MMKHNRTTMGLVRAVIICAVFGLSSGELHSSGSLAEVWLVKAVGATIRFNTSQTPAPYTDLSWKFHDMLPIITVNANGTSVRPSYADRITLFDDGSLEIRNLTKSDTGDYTVNIKSAGSPEFNREFLLEVLERVSDVSLSASATDLTEFSVVKLTCSASGSDLRFSWFNNSQPMEEFPTSVIGYIYMIVKRYDTGPFACEVHNPINTVSSEGVNFTISYGPEVELKAVPSNNTYADGSSVTLVCTVDSKPEAEISWYHIYGLDDERLLPFNGTELVLEDLTWEKSGIYRCEAYNRKTGHIGSRTKSIHVEYKCHDCLSVGAIIGIVAACVAVGAGFAAGLAYLYHIKINPREIYRIDKG